MKIPPHLQLATADAICRRSLHAFFQRSFAISHGGKPLALAPYIEAMCYQLERLQRGEIRRLIITVPPRHGKSELVSVAFIAWVMGLDPTAKFMVASYGLELSRAHSELTRVVLRDPAYRRMFPGTQIADGHDKAHLYRTTAGGERRAVSLGGSVTGHGAHTLVIDDLHKADEALTEAGRAAAIQFYQNSLLSRFDNPADGRIVMIQQRLHEQDIVGWALEQGGDWHHLNLPAEAEEDEEIPLSRGRVWQRRKGDLLHPNRMPLLVLNERRLELGTRAYNAQYQQNPIASDGSQIRLAWFGQYDERPDRGFFHKVVQSWDPAITERITSDFSVGMTWGYRDGKWYLLDLIRQKLVFHDLLDRMLHWHREWRADALLIEGASIGHSLWQEAKRASLPGKVLCCPPVASKLDRLAGRTAQLATGDYILPAAAPWLVALRHELVAFPDGRNDDQVDALTQFLEFAFGNDRWAKTELGPDGRPLRIQRPERRPRRYEDEPTRSS
jgi:predicted phage terminase large subunit-like protein